MSLYFRPIIESDKTRMTKGAASKVDKAPFGILSGKSTSDAQTSVSNLIFGEESAHSSDKIYTFEDEYTKVGYIELNEKIINPFLAGRNYTAWAILTDIKTSDVQKIVKYELVYDKELDELVPIDNVADLKYDKKRFLIGVDYLLYKLKNTDHMELIRDYLYENYVKEIESILGVRGLRKCIKMLDMDMVQDIQDADPFDHIPVMYLNDGFVLDLPMLADLSLPENSGEAGRWIDAIIDPETGLHTQSYYSLFGYFYDPVNEEYYYGAPGLSEDWLNSNSADTPEQFNKIQLYRAAIEEGTAKVIEDQIMPFLFVLPIGYRPEMKKQHSKITLAYNKIVQCNSTLADVKRRNDNTLSSYTKACRDLQKSIEHLMVRNSVEQDEDYKSLADELKGKNGFVRDRLEGARIDFSGRTVIILDPTLPIDTIGVPIKMLEKIAEPTLVRAFTKEAKSHKDWHIYGNMTGFHNAKDSGKYGISYIDFLKYFFNTHDIYGIIGRQPTLFYLGMQGFKIKPTEGDAVSLSPLVVMPFNADFDGDQMHFSMPITEEGIADVRDKMLFKNNIWYPKNGQITVEVRHEIQYGLWECLTRTNDGTDSGCSTREEVYNKICDGSISVGSSYKGTTAGIAAFNYCVFGNSAASEFDLNKIMSKSKNTTSNMSPIQAIKAKKLSKMLYDVTGGTTGFLNAINKLVKLGFAISKFYPPSISVITRNEMKAYIQSEIDKFNRQMLDYKKYVDLGMEMESNYNLRFSDAYGQVVKKIEAYIMANLPESNGYWRMVVSEAKGDISNLLQIYGIKGRVQKSDFEAFNTTIDGSYAGQLTGLEHFVTAYGSRKGIADKVLSTAKPGYMSRKLEHAGSQLKVTTTDCSAGVSAEDIPAVEFYPHDIIPFINEGNLSRRGIRPTREDDETEFYSDASVKIQLKEAAKTLSKMLVGRYCIKDNDAKYFINNEDVAESLILKCWGDGSAPKPVRMRSPITCSNPTCQICYGRDIAANTKAPKVGRKVGFIAAQAIGEPGTQMVMKNFQKGGVVGEANITSSFDLIEASFDLKDFSKEKYENGIVRYDPVSPVSGFVKKINVGANKSEVYITATSSPHDNVNLLRRKIYVSNRADLKKYVRKGETIFFSLGNVNVRDVVRYAGFEDAVKYLLLNLYTTFKQTDVNMIHFECIIKNMICYKVLIPFDRYKTGDIISYIDINQEGGNGVPTLVGVKYLPKYRQDFLQSLAMESQTTYIPRAIINSRYDDLNDPIIKTALGLHLNS